MGLVKGLFKALIVFIVIAAVAGFFLPTTAHVERSISIDKPIDEVFGVLNGFEEFNRWSPWYKEEPEATYNYFGPTMGVGSGMSWDGVKVGSGSQEITAVTGNSKIEILLKFEGQGDSTAFYQLTKVGGATNVIWGFDATMEGYLERYIVVVMDMMLGGYYEQGLNDLKTFMESKA